MTTISIVKAGKRVGFSRPGVGESVRFGVLYDIDGRQAKWAPFLNAEQARERLTAMGTVSEADLAKLKAAV